MLNSIVQTQLKKIKSGFARPVGYPKTQITKVGVVGAGLMGHGISLVSSLNGIEVILLDKTEELSTYGLLKINEILKNKIDRKEISLNEREQILRLIYATDNYSILKDCDLIIEAVFEDEKLKSDIFKNFKKMIKDDAILSSNTSSIPISKLANYSNHPENFIGIHFFSPVHKMKLVEIIKGDKTNQGTLSLATEFVRKINKERLKKVIIEASEQSNRIKLPKLEKLIKFDEFMKLYKDTNVIFGDLNSKNNSVSISNILSLAFNILSSNSLSSGVKYLSALVRVCFRM